MKYKQTAAPLSRTALSLSVVAMTIASITGTTKADDHKPTDRRQPAASPEASKGITSRASSYWTGEYWDAQKGSSFWHNLTPSRSSISDKSASGTANGSKRVRDLQRSRASAAAKARR